MGIPRPCPLKRNFLPADPTASGHGAAVTWVRDQTHPQIVSAYPNKSGDIKLEGNIEYRFKVIWKMEGAIFLDAGNVWAIRPEEGKPGADVRVEQVL